MDWAFQAFGRLDLHLVQLRLTMSLADLPVKLGYVRHSKFIKANENLFRANKHNIIWVEPYPLTARWYWNHWISVLKGNAIQVSSNQSRKDMMKLKWQQAFSLTLRHCKCFEVLEKKYHLFFTIPDQEISWWSILCFILRTPDGQCHKFLDTLWRIWLHTLFCDWKHRSRLKCHINLTIIEMMDRI